MIQVARYAPAVIRTSFTRPERPLLIDTAAFGQRKCSATKAMSSSFALPSIGGALSCARQLPSVNCMSAEVRALGFTFTRMRLAGMSVARQLRGARRRALPRPALGSLAGPSSPGVHGRPRRCSM